MFPNLYIKNPKGLFIFAIIFILIFFMIRSKSLHEYLTISKSEAPAAGAMQKTSEECAGDLNTQYNILNAKLQELTITLQNNTQKLQTQIDELKQTVDFDHTHILYLQEEEKELRKTVE